MFLHLLAWIGRATERSPTQPAKTTGNRTTVSRLPFPSFTGMIARKSAAVWSSNILMVLLQQRITTV